MSAAAPCPLAGTFRWHLDAGLDLGLLEARHTAALYALVDGDRAHLRRYLPWVDATRGPHDSGMFIQTMLEHFARSQSLSVGIFSEGELAGVLGYHLIDWGNRKTSLGYWLARRFEGRGLMTRAVRAMTHHAFTQLGLHRLEIRAATDNARSRAVAERAGYRLEGVCPGSEWLHDRFVDHAIYGALRPTWTP